MLVSLAVVDRERLVSAAKMLAKQLVLSPSERGRCLKSESVFMVLSIYCPFGKKCVCCFP